MAAGATRSASRRVARDARNAEAVATGALGALSHDELGVIVDGLADPLLPVVAVALSSTCKALRHPLRSAIEVLKERHAKAKALCRKVCIINYRNLGGGVSFCDNLTRLRHAGYLCFRPESFVTAGDMSTLGMLMCWLPALHEVYLNMSGFTGLGLVALCDALARSAAPSLKTLRLCSNDIGPAGAEALAAVLSRGALPNLKMLDLSQNPLGSLGATALAAPLRALPALKVLLLCNCRIGDEGVASLVANLGKDDFKALEDLDLKDNDLTDEGYATLVTALDKGAMPQLDTLLMLTDHFFDEQVALSEQAMDAFRAAADRRDIKTVDDKFCSPEAYSPHQGFDEDEYADLDDEDEYGDFDDEEEEVSSSEDHEDGEGEEEGEDEGEDDDGGEEDTEDENSA